MKLKKQSLKQFQLLFILFSVRLSTLLQQPYNFFSESKEFFKIKGSLQDVHK
jgi:hypothetical protein